MTCGWRGIAWLMSLGAAGCAAAIAVASLAFGRQAHQHARLAEAQAEIRRQERTSPQRMRRYASGSHLLGIINDILDLSDILGIAAIALIAQRPERFIDQHFGEAEDRV
jgi:hypothetical protein